MYADLNHADHHYRKKMQQLEQWMITSRLPPPMRIRMRTYFEILYPGNLAFNEKDILGELSLPLRQEVCEFKTRAVLKQLGIANSWSAGLAGAVAMQLTRHVHLRGEVLIHEGRKTSGLLFVTHGDLAVERFQRDQDDKLVLADDGKPTAEHLAVLKEGGIVGEMSLLDQHKLASATVTVRSMHCQVHKLDKATYNSLAQIYPELKRYLLRLAETRTKQNKARNKDEDGADGHYLFDAFLAHTWVADSLGRDNHERVATINRALKERGLNTWFDEDRLCGDINIQMADGIDRSRAVVIFITHAYMVKVNGDGPNGENDNAKFEFDLALLKKGVQRMVPIVMDPEVKDTKNWTGVVAGKFGTRLYIDCSEDDLSKGIDEVSDKIIKMLGNANEQSEQNQAQTDWLDAQIAAENAQTERESNDSISGLPKRRQISMYLGGRAGSSIGADSHGGSFGDIAAVSLAAVRLENAKRRGTDARRTNGNQITE